MSAVSNVKSITVALAVAMVMKEGECVGLFYPDLASNAIQGRNLDYHWDGERVDLYRNPGNGEWFGNRPNAHGTCRRN